MKGSKLSRFFALSLSLICISGLYSGANAQEYDDMYFNKSDRKSVKVDKVVAVSDKNIATDYKEMTESTETYSSKNVNPEYIARYKSTEADEQTLASAESYSDKDYFVEDYDKESYTGDPDKNNIDYEALALRDKMSYSNYNRSYSSPSWRFNPYMTMGMGYGAFGYPRYGYYDPYMMGSFYDPFMMNSYGPGMTMGIGMGFGYGYSPSMSYNIGMSWGSGFGYPGYYNPWNSMYGFNSFGYGSMYACPPYMAGRYGFYPTTIIYANGSGSEFNNGRRIEYKPRTTRSNASLATRRAGNENLRTSSSSDRIRIPNRDAATSASNGRTRSDLSRAQNEYYSRSRRSSSSAQRISSTTRSSNRSSYIRNSGSTAKSSSMYSNRPSRTSSGFTSGSRGRSSYSNRSSYSGNRSGSSTKSSSSYSSPSRNSYSSGGTRSSSFSSGGSRSSGSSYSGSSSSSGSRSSGGSSSSGRRQ